MPDRQQQRFDFEELTRYLSMVELLKHSAASGTEPSRRRSRWQVFLESPGGTALITVIIGGIVAGAVGQYLTYRYQQSLRQREIATATYNAYLQRAENTIVRSFALIGHVMSASEDLMQLANTVWDPEHYPKAARPQVVAYRDKTIAAFRSAANEWKHERQQQALLLQYYHNANPQVIQAWNKLQQSVTQYADCAYQLYWHRGDTFNATPTAVSCMGERQVVLTNLDQFTLSRLAAAREQAESSGR